MSNVIKRPCFQKSPTYIYSLSSEFEGLKPLKWALFAPNLIQKLVEAAAGFFKPSQQWEEPGVWEPRISLEVKACPRRG